MTASLLVFIPIVLLGVFAAFCFVGCALIYDYSDYKAAPDEPDKPNKVPTYSDDVLDNKDCVAYWPCRTQ
jgi:hypothetical protein